MKLFIPALALSLLSFDAFADTTQAACEVFPEASGQESFLVSCTYSQRQGYISINREDGVTYDLSPRQGGPGNFTDQNGRKVYRKSGLGDQGQIYAFPDERVYVWWDATRFEVSEPDNWTAPFSTDEFDATTRLRCKAPNDSEYGLCSAGIMRMDGGQASITVQNQLGEQFTINFMTDYVNATNREVEAQLKGDTWILNFANGEEWQVPLAAIEGG